MKSILLRRPSPALVISCIALFVSLGGLSYGVATGFIDSREIKNNTVRSADVRNNTLRTFDLRNNEVRGVDIRNSTVRGRDVALNTLTGADISEKDLAKVPSAAAADTATSATTAGSAATAGSVGGMTVRKFFTKPASGAAPVEILRGDGFVLEGGCTAANPVLRLTGIAGAAATNAAVQGTGDGATVPFFGADTALGAGDNFSLLEAGDTSGAGTATVSTTGGAVATITFGAEGSAAFPGEAVCALRGTVTSG